jgi:hypothetical protein
MFAKGSIGQLRLLLGHLRLQDKMANLILIDISYLQLLVGSATLFFNLPYQQYKCCVDNAIIVYYKVPTCDTSALCTSPPTST